MKNCSYCGRENDDAAVACSECATEFESLPAHEVDQQLQDSALSLVIVGSFTNVIDATMVKTRLEAAGIEACIPEEYTPQIFWYGIPSPLERITVRVAAKDYETARQILAADA